MKRGILLTLIAALLLNLCSFACAAGEVCIDSAGAISFEHSYSQGVCAACGYVFDTCDHANIVPRGTLYEETEKQGADFHAKFSFHSDVCDFCLDCRSTLVDGTVQDVPADQYTCLNEAVAHTMVNSVCIECGYMNVRCFKAY